YDKVGRVTGVTGLGGSPGYATALAYRAFGAIKGLNYGDGRSLSTAYDNRLRPTKWDVSNVLGYNYNYDYLNEHTGRVSYAGSIYDATLDRSYEYDNVGRLVISHAGAEARAHVGTGQWGTMDGPYSQGYEYDFWGNITKKYGWGGEVQGGSPGQNGPDINRSYTNNRIDGFSYDAARNLTNDLGQTFTYDATGQQATAAYTGYSLTQSYDGDGLRVKKNDNGAVTYYLRSSVLGGQVAAEMGSNGARTREYLYLGGQLLALRTPFGRGVKNYWVHEDPITKSKRITDNLGTVVSTIEMDPWGADTNRSNNAAFQPKKFTSYERDANGSDEAMFRRSNRWHSRFDQPDPYDGSYSLANPQSFNRYAYVQNDPVNFVDPTGLVESWNCHWTPSGWVCGGVGSVDIYVSWADELSAATGGPDENWIPGRHADSFGFGGGKGGVGAGTGGKQIGPNEYNNCYEFVDYLVSLATGLSLKPPSAFQANRENRNMVIDLGFRMIQEAFDYKYINNISDGFKDKLVGGFQNAGVYGHVLLQGGAYLVGGLTGRAYAYGFAGYDKFQAGLVGTGVYPHQQDDQRPAEIAGNEAGGNVGKHMWSLLTGHRDSNKLKEDLTQELCKPNG
ncbi:MAG: RHS repeat domain-containing protein, partial [Pyrinomonadaceae bacterium]